MYSSADGTTFIATIAAEHEHHAHHQQADQRQPALVAARSAGVNRSADRVH